MSGSIWIRPARRGLSDSDQGTCDMGSTCDLSGEGVSGLIHGPETPGGGGASAIPAGYHAMFTHEIGGE